MRIIDRQTAASSGADTARCREFLNPLWSAVGGTPDILDKVEFTGEGDLPSVFAVSDLAAASVAVAGAAIAELVKTGQGEIPEVRVDRRRASLWFAGSLKPEGWSVPAAWDPLAGDYPTADGWIRLHTNAPHHRAAALAALGGPPTREAVAEAVVHWTGDALEAAIVARGGCAATMRSTEAWRAHPQGQSLGEESLLTGRALGATERPDAPPIQGRPLQGVRVLDLTRVLAGPVATRFLAGFGAEVLRIDPPDWDEPAVLPEVTLGKRCARLDLRAVRDQERFRELLRAADVLVHGYRADALDGLGFDEDIRQALRPGLIDVSLDAYGWRGPWRQRRGFDSLVQMSCGIADAGMRGYGTDRPKPLPVQAIDHATGYLMAAAAIRGLTQRRETGRGLLARTSLARLAELLMSGPPGRPEGELRSARESDWSTALEATGFGPAHRLLPPLEVASAPMQWDRPAARLGSAPPQW